MVGFLWSGLVRNLNLLEADLDAEEQRPQRRL